MSCHLFLRNELYCCESSLSMNVLLEISFFICSLLWKIWEKNVWISWTQKNMSRLWNPLWRGKLLKKIIAFPPCCLQKLWLKITKQEIEVTIEKHCGATVGKSQNNNNYSFIWSADNEWKDFLIYSACPSHLILSCIKHSWVDVITAAGPIPPRTRSWNKMAPIYGDFRVFGEP